MATMTATYKPIISVRKGYSGVDHFADEVAWFAEQALDGKTYTSKAGAVRAGRAAIRKALTGKSPNASGRSYAKYGLTGLSFGVEAA